MSGSRPRGASTWRRASATAAAGGLTTGYRDQWLLYASTVTTPSVCRSRRRGERCRYVLFLSSGASAKSRAFCFPGQPAPNCVAFDCLGTRTLHATVFSSAPPHQMSQSSAAIRCGKRPLETDAWNQHNKKLRVGDVCLGVFDLGETFRRRS